MKKILIPTDTSELADFAYELAHQIALHTDASISVLSVVPAPPDAFFDPQGNLKNDEGEDYSTFYQRRDRLKERLNTWAKHKTDIEATEVKIGRVDEDIVQYAVDHGIDLIVMGTSGSQGVEEFIRNSHAAHIVRNSPVPVLTLKCDRSGMKMNDMLLVGDFRESDKMDLTAVKAIQEAFGATVHLLTINTAAHFETSREIQEHMKAFIRLNELTNVETHVYCDESVEKGILNFSEEADIDFIMMATHQRKGISRLFRRSISEGVVNHIWHPILTFPV